MISELETDWITEKIIGCAIRVHQILGPGLLESIYERCLVHELQKAGLRVERQRSIRVEYDGLVFEEAYRLDLLVEDSVIVELKAVDAISSIHRAQLLTYLRLLKKPTGLLINFNEELLHRGLSRVILPPHFLS